MTRDREGIGGFSLYVGGLFIREYIRYLPLKAFKNMKLFFTDDEFQSSYRSSVVQFPNFSLTFEVMQ